MMHQMTQDGLDIQEQAGFPFLQGLEPTLRAINALWFFAQRSGRAPAIVEPAPPSDLTPANLDATLARYGITQPQSRAVASAQEAADAAAAIGFPVALKIRSADIVHKTEAGGVMLDLGRPARRARRRRHVGESRARGRTRTPRSTVFWCRKWCPASKRSSAPNPIRSTARCC